MKRIIPKNSRLIVGLSACLYLLPFARANELDGACRTSMPGVLSDTLLPDKPFYFFRSFPMSNQIAYSAMNPLGPDGNDNYGENFLFDFKTGEKKRIPGKLDAVPTPDEKWILTPMAHGGPLEFYRNSLTIDENSPAAYTDPDLAGAYQSVGILPSADSRVITYRILIQSPTGGIKMKDVSTSGAAVLPSPQRAKRVCGNITDSLKLPMLSKDGSRLSAFNEDGKPPSTRIYKIDPITFDCELEHDFGFGTGKVDFSYTGDQVTFHAFGMKESGKWIRLPDSSVMGNSFILDLRTKEIRKITQFTNTNALYPSFNKNGEITVRIADGARTRILKIDPKANPIKMSLANFATDGHALSPTSENDRIVAIGSLVQFLCLKNTEGVFAYRAPTHFLSLDRAACRKLIPLWDANKQGLAKAANKRDAALYRRLTTLSMTELLNACPVEDREGTPFAIAPADFSKLQAGPAEMARIASKSCLECHNSSYRKSLAFMEPVSALTLAIAQNSVTPEKTRKFEAQMSKALFVPSRTDPKRPLIDEMISRISKGDVPPFPKAPLNSVETQTLIRYLENLRASHRTSN